jgi:hypothetical protein
MRIHMFVVEGISLLFIIAGIILRSALLVLYGLLAWQLCYSLPNWTATKTPSKGNSILPPTKRSEKTKRTIDSRVIWPFHTAVRFQ